ncbi:MAG TPA: DHH family phosphoesterase [Candidatus Alectryocaccobium stercorigallinarum]|nr:DHH family phosphoesterase [Candidatus Alectryocaccobium stercorigallinarum]
MDKKHTGQNGQTQSYLTFMMLMLILLIGINILVYIRDFYSGLIMTAGVVAYAVIAIIYFYYKKRRVLSELVGFVSAYATIQNRMMDQFDFPLFLIDRDMRLLWGNRAFMSLGDDMERFKLKPVNELFPEIKIEKLPRMGSQTDLSFIYDNYKYRASIRLISQDDMLAVYNFPDLDREDLKKIYAVALFDETRLYEYMQKYEDETMVTATLYLDNYEEALESVEEVSRSILTALIDRKINQYFNGFDCLVRKYEKDKYLVLMRTSSMRKIAEHNFSILEDIKEINTDNDISVTVSMGIGCNQGSYVKNLEASRICIDLALGRGGDQVVVKNGDGIRYFGGKAPGVERNTKVKARVKAHALHEFISVAEKVVVMGHKIMDVDAFGAAIGIFRASQTLNKRTHIVYDNESIALKPFLDIFRNDGSYDEKLLVTCDEAKELVDEKTLLVVVDTSKADYTECEELLYMTKNIVVLDHHRQSGNAIKTAMLSYIEPYASSACEMVAEILQYFSDDMKLKSTEADVLYAGIVLDTNNFVQKTGVRTFEAAAYLRRSGADVTRVRKMFREDMKDYLAKGEAVRNVKLFRGCFAISACPSIASGQPSVVGAQAANELLNIVGVKASFVLSKNGEKVFISARAIDEVNVQIIMERLGGGGHLNVAGCQLTGVTLEEAEERLCRLLEEMQDGGEI